MSNWAHVAGIIRVNSLRRTGDTEQQAKERMLKIFGKSFGSQKKYLPINLVGIMRLKQRMKMRRQ